MTDADIDGARPGPGSQDRANDLEVVQQRDRGAAPASGFGVFAHEPALGATDRRQVAENSQMTCNAKAARMGQSVTIAHEQVGRRVEPTQRFEQGRRLAKGEQPGHIRKLQPAPRHALFRHAPLRHVPQDDRPQTEGMVGRECRIETGDEAGFSPQRFDLDTGGEALLNGDRAAG